MTKIEVLWRTGYEGLPPRPIKLQIPGWAGDDFNHDDGATPQPWHCPPFVEGSTYGLELVYNLNDECHVSIRDGRLQFDGDFSPETIAALKQPPFGAFAPNHYGLTSSVDLLVPDDMVLRVEPHPRFFTDMTGTCPCAVPGNIHTPFWPRLFFVVFKAPWPGQTHVFRKGEPYAQVLVVPRKAHYDLKPMTEEQAKVRERMSAHIRACGDEIAKHIWTDHKGSTFDDKYKILQSAFLRGGREGLEKVLLGAIKAWLAKQARAGRKSSAAETPTEGKFKG